MSTRRVLGWLGLALALAAGSALAQPLVKDGDRVVIYGDSITEQRLYSRYVMQYLLNRYPNMKLHFYNAGWSGDTAGGAANRLERDVLTLKPTLVTLYFGMNDGGYRAVNDETVSNYRNNMDKLVAAIKAAGVQVVVFSPGCVDPDRREALAACNYNGMLEALAGAAKEVAEKHQVPYFDVFHPMLEVQTKLKAADPSFTMIGDAVHPGANGHLVTAHAMLQGLGVEPMPPLGAVDLNSGAADGLRIISQNEAQVVVQATGQALVPFWYESGSQATADASGMATFAGQRLTIKGLKTGAYQIAANGEPLLKASAEELAAGISVPGTASQAGKRSHDLCQRKEDNYFTAWRQVRLPFGELPEGQAVYDGLMAADEGYQQLLWRYASEGEQPVLTISPVPVGENLALKAPYTVSDENTYNWGIGGLTNGSWANGANGAFATGDSPTLPKFATIDLGRSARIGTVIVGVPDVGSQKTITVSVSLDGQAFTEVGSHEFEQRKAQRWIYAFGPRDARYVRLTWPDRWDDEVGYSRNFSFATEAEVYAAP